MIKANVKYWEHPEIPFVWRESQYCVGEIVLIDVSSPDGVLKDLDLRGTFAVVCDYYYDEVSGVVNYTLSNGFTFTADQLVKPNCSIIESGLRDILLKLKA